MTAPSGAASVTSDSWVHAEDPLLREVARLRHLDEASKVTSTTSPMEVDFNFEDVNYVRTSDGIVSTSFTAGDFLEKKIPFETCTAISGSTSQDIFGAFLNDFVTSCRFPETTSADDWWKYFNKLVAEEPPNLSFLDGSRIHFGTGFNHALLRVERLLLSTFKKYYFDASLGPQDTDENMTYFVCLNLKQTRDLAEQELRRKSGQQDFITLHGTDRFGTLNFHKSPIGALLMHFWRSINHENIGEDFEPVTLIRFVPGFALKGNFMKISNPHTSVNSFNRYYEDFTLGIMDGTFDLRSLADTRAWQTDFKIKKLDALLHSHYWRDYSLMDFRQARHFINHFQNIVALREEDTENLKGDSVVNPFGNLTVEDFRSAFGTNLQLRRWFFETVNLHGGIHLAKGSEVYHLLPCTGLSKATSVNTLRVCKYCTSASVTSGHSFRPDHDFVTCQVCNNFTSSQDTAAASASGTSTSPGRKVVK